MKQLVFKEAPSIQVPHPGMKHTADSMANLPLDNTKELHVTMVKHQHVGGFESLPWGHEDFD